MEDAFTPAPVVQEVVSLGGLRSDLLSDIGQELRLKARAIPGFLRSKGLDWRALAEAHYHEPGAVVVEELPADWRGQSNISFETISVYIELVHLSLEYAFPSMRDEHYEDGEYVERLCSCQRSVQAGRRADR